MKFGLVFSLHDYKQKSNFAMMRYTELKKVLLIWGRERCEQHWWNAWCVCSTRYI